MDISFWDRMSNSVPDVENRPSAPTTDERVNIAAKRLAAR
jgi:hypothetical protein